MKALVASVLIVGAIAATSIFAAAPSTAPAGSMGMCNDGTYSTSAEKKGACRGHKGVKDWYGEAAAPAPGKTTVTTTTTAAPMTSAPAAPATATTTHKSSTTAVAGGAAPAPGGGAGQVWVNESTKVYHCSGDRWYGKTKQGAYMSEADAKAKGNHADHGKACSS